MQANIGRDRQYAESAFNRQVRTVFSPMIHQMLPTARRARRYTATKHQGFETYCHYGKERVNVKVLVRTARHDQVPDRDVIVETWSCIEKREVGWAFEPVVRTTFDLIFQFFDFAVDSKYKGTAYAWRMDAFGYVVDALRDGRLRRIMRNATAEQHPNGKDGHSERVKVPFFEFLDAIEGYGRSEMGQAHPLNSIIPVFRSFPVDLTDRFRNSYYSKGEQGLPPHRTNLLIPRRPQHGAQ